MNSAVLFGREHQQIGAIAAIAEGACSVAISRGGARKKYRHRDPNEDAAAFVAGEAGIFIAVADAHEGCLASEVAIQQLAERFAPAWTQGADPTAADWKETALAVFTDLNESIVREVARSDERISCTTLSFALVRPREGRLAFAAVGDSHVFRVGKKSADDIARDAGAYTAFLGPGEQSPDALRSKIFAGTQSLEGIRAVVLATDGVSERGIGLEAPSFGVLEATRSADSSDPSARSLVTARRLVELALAAQRENASGDNVATAVAWLAD